MATDHSSATHTTIIKTLKTVIGKKLVNLFLIAESALYIHYGSIFGGDRIIREYLVARRR
jgi:hypothetical protein